MEIDECPCGLVEPGVWELVRGADWVADGHWPNGNGWMNECAGFVDGVRLVQAEDAYARRAKRNR